MPASSFSQLPTPHTEARRVCKSIRFSLWFRVHFVLCLFNLVVFCCCCGYYKAWHCVVCCWQVGNFKVCRAVPLATIANCMENVKWTEKNCDFSDYQFRPLFSSLFFWLFSQKITRKFKCEKRCGQRKQRSATVCLFLFSAGVEVAQKLKAPPKSK